MISHCGAFGCYHPLVVGLRTVSVLGSCLEDIAHGADLLCPHIIYFCIALVTAHVYGRALNWYADVLLMLL